MLVMRPRATWLFGGVLLASACTAEAQEFSANGFLDGGLVIPSHDKSWLKGGFGKLDNGGGGGQSPALVSQGVADLRLTLDPSAFVFATVRPTSMPRLMCWKPMAVISRSRRLIGCGRSSSVPSSRPSRWKMKASGGQARGL